MCIRAILTTLFMTLTASGALAQRAQPTAAPAGVPGLLIIDSNEVGRIEGQVTQATDGAPIGGAQIELLRPSPTLGRAFPEPWVPVGGEKKSTVVARLQTAADGSFRIDGITPGNYTLSGDAPEGSDRIDISLSAQRPVRAVHLTLDQGRQIIGSVSDAHGRPLAEVFVYISGIDVGDGLNSVDSDRPAPWTRSNSEGSFQLTHLPKGTLYLQAAHTEVGYSDLVEVTEADPNKVLSFKIDVKPERFDPNLNPGGIGISLHWTASGPTISRVLPNKPADRAGLLVGDRITAIDGRSTLFMSSVEFIARCKGPVGTRVSLNIRRAQQTIAVQIQRELLSP